MSTSKSLLQAAMAMESLALAGDSIAFARKKKKRFVRQAGKIIVGASLIKAQGDLVGAL